MGQLAFVGSHRINGVSAMHSDLMKETVFHDLNHLYPGRITNKTNGITFRRWLMLANPKLTDLMREACGEAVLDDSARLERLEARASDNAFQQQFRDVKHHNKVALARLIGERLSIKVDPSALFDVQIKRIHEYKRQLLNILETVALYHAIKDEPQRDWVPRVKIFAGKAAASYRYAKLIIKLINDVAEVVNNDPVIARTAEGRVPRRLQCQPRRGDHSGRRSVRADFDRRHGSLRHRQHEAGAERRADHRHARRRQYRNPRPCRRGEHRDLRHGGDGRGGAAQAGAGRDRRDQPLAAAGARHHARSSAARSRPTIPARFASIAHALRHLDHYMVSADFDSYYEGPARHRRALAGGAGLDPRLASSTWRGCRGSPPTAPSANMPRRSGTCRCARRAACRQASAQRGAARSRDRSGMPGVIDESSVGLTAITGSRPRRAAECDAVRIAATTALRRTCGRMLATQ